LLLTAQAPPAIYTLSLHDALPIFRRDIAVVVEESVPAAAVEACVREAAGALLRELIVFDVYRGKGVREGCKSLAMGLILQDSSRSEEHTSELQSRENLVCRLLLEK